ncbi:hypothetical protein [Microbacterium murale]|uniref:DUF4352 domain-containing protein n=1 Tax=Microbacterium murale TaxID=1081040 RepID=A0ABU0P8W9_9MICO|nr:hypothetical protein [Microbacterium murale]MDQ0643773.1 hypothetical protein [Microbacterium murale]
MSDLNPAAPAPQQLPPPMPPPTAAASVPRKTNVIALIALIVAIAGFVFACIPGALILGWILLPIAFVLSIVSLFLKGDRKWMGIVGLIVSIVGTIVGFVVFFAVIANAASEAFGDTDTTVTQPADEEDAAAVEEEPAEAAAQGTRENPYPIASQISTDDWTVVVNSHTVDGAAAVADGNMFNDPAPAGSHYEIVNYTVTYTGDESGLAVEVSMALVTSAGNVVNSYDAMVSLADGIGMDELYNSASATGSEAFLIPDGETALIRVRPGMLADEVFVKP